jgi:putative aldouronate transport system substrate-binding protein
MKTKRGIPVMLLAVVLVISLAACATPTPVATQAPTSAPVPTVEPTPEPIPNFNATGYPIVPEKITLKAFQWELDNQDIDYPNLWFFQELEKKTNIHIDFQEVKGADWTTQLSLMFTSGKYSDVIIRPASMDVEEYGVTQKILIPLDDLIAKYMPIYAERIAMEDANADIMKASDGKMYYIGYLLAQSVNHQGNWFIDKAWLDKLSKPVPTTFADYTAALRAMKADQPAKYPLGGDLASWVIPNGHDMTENLLNFFAMFGVPENSYYVYLDDSKKVQFTGAQAGYRAGLEWLHTMYAEGILDPEALTQASSDFANKINDETYGAVTYLRLINTAIKPEILPNWVSIVPPAAEGYKTQVSRILELPTTMGALITTANKYPEATARWIDEQFETETMFISSNGPIAAGAPIEPTLEFKDGKYNVLSVPADNGLYNLVPVTTGQWFAPGQWYFSIFNMPPHRVERFNYSNEYEAAGVLEANSFHYLTASKLSTEDTEERTRIFTALDKFMFESFNDFVKNGVDDAKWTKFQNDAKAIGVEQYVALYQKAYDESPFSK